MSEPIFLSAQLELAKDDSGESRGDKSITGVAYSGDAVVQWGERLVIDIASINADTPIALLHQHSHRDSIGVIDGLNNDGKQLTISSGRIFAGMDSDPLPGQIAEKASRGFPYELSVGIYDGSAERVPSGKKVSVNGREFTGPITIIRNANLREVSIVALGADASTQADIAASQKPHQPEEADMAKDPEKHGDGADSASTIVELTQRVAELTQQLDAANERAESAEKALDEHRTSVRLSAVKALLSDIGIEFSEEAAKPYMELSDEAFDAMAEQVRGKLSAGTEHARMFSDTGPSQTPSSQSPATAAALDINEIYAKRRVS